MNPIDPPAPNMIQELPWSQTIQAIKDSVRFDTFAAFRAHLEEHLPYNSASTRERYGQTIAKYFFPNESLDTLPRRAWAAYRDDQLLEDLLRYQFLAQEPTVARFLVAHVLPLVPGSVLERTVVEGFIQEIDPQGRRKMAERLALALRRMGLLMREQGQDVVAQRRPSKTALLLQLHHLLAPTPRIVTLRDILADPFWQYLGLREEGMMRQILHEAHGRGLIARYAAVDQLEQITTRYTLDEWFEQRLRL